MSLLDLFWHPRRDIKPPKPAQSWTIPAAGWTCPKCQRIWGPQVEECRRCNEWEDDQ